MRKDIFYSEAIRALRPSSGFVIEGCDYSTLVWKDNNTTPPTKEEVEVKALQLEEEYNSKDYARKRVLGYPPIGDQLDMLWHAMDNGTLPKYEPFYNAIKSVKDQFPKV